MPTRKLEPIPVPMRTLVETRKELGYSRSGISRGEYGVARPVEWRAARRRSSLAQNGPCWAEVRLRGTSDYAPDFKGCETAAREGFLTCRIHQDRELAARELVCELDRVSLHDITYASAEEKETEREKLLEDIRARWGE